MSKRFDLLIFIGRFSPFHRGHRRVVELALEQADHLLILVGSASQPRTIKNPFTYEEREQMIQASLDPQHIARLTIRPLRDYLYNETLWITEVQRNVSRLQVSLVGQHYATMMTKVGIIGYEKDASSYYLKKFPQFEFVDVGRDYVETIDATTIRQMWLKGHSPVFTQGAVHSYVQNFMYETFPKKERERLTRELEHIENYRKQWEVAPYPVTFVTVDAVVIQSGHVLVVQRKSAPGEGLYAIPGGFLNQNEHIVDAALRELREETKIKVPEAVLRGSIKSSHVFDAPNRSLRGRTITHAFLIDLPPGELPKVKGSDDAAKARWIPLGQFERMERDFFEDHHHIINFMLGRV